MVDDQIKEIFFPEESVLIIKKILEKYNLLKINNELKKNFLGAATPEKRNEILNEIPSIKIARILRGYQFGTTNLEDFPKILKEGLKIPQKDAEGITEELKEKILIFSKPTFEAENKPPERKGRPDVYRESIE